MTSQIKILKEVAKEKGLTVEDLDKDKIFFSISNESKSEHFIYTSFPLNNSVVNRICKDKEYTFRLLKDDIQMPNAIGFLDPNVKEEYSEFKHENSYKEIIEKINGKYEYPIIIKPNQGSMGRNVFKCNSDSEVEESLSKIYKKDSTNYDYVAIAQDFIQIEKEYRVITLDGQIQFFYLKDNSNAKFSDNLSPLHWENSRAVLINDFDLKQRLQEFINSIFKKMELVYSGIDVGITKENELFLIELNSHPGFEIFIRDNGVEEVEKLFSSILDKLFG